jgi:hypothetical protein
MILKRCFAGLFCYLFLGALGQAADQGDNASSMFFPQNWVRGWVDAAVAPPHGEPDLNRCAATAGADGGEDAPCSAFARYVLSGYIELQPVGTGPLKRIYVFAQPELYLGKNVPHFEYSASAAPMAFARAFGVGIVLSKNFDLRVAQHRVEWLGRYNSYLGKADTNKSGPLGLYTTVSVRWYFGRWGQRASVH